MRQGGHDLGVARPRRAVARARRAAAAGAPGVRDVGTTRPCRRQRGAGPARLTGDAPMHGPPGPGRPTPGWWAGIVGPGLALDTDRWFVVAANVLGGCQGSTGPSSGAPDGRAWGSRFLRITVGDQVQAELRLAGRLGVRLWAAVIGGSRGGMRVLEHLVAAPDRVGAALALATSGWASAEQIAVQTLQVACHRRPCLEGRRLPRDRPRPHRRSRARAPGRAPDLPHRGRARRAHRGRPASGRGPVAQRPVRRPVLPGPPRPTSSAVASTPGPPSL